MASLFEKFRKRQEAWVNDPTVQKATLVSLSGICISAGLLFIFRSMIFVFTGFLSVIVFVLIAATRKPSE